MRVQSSILIQEFETRESVEASLDFPEAHFLDITVNAMTAHDLHEATAFAIATGKKWLIANHNLHSLYLLHKEMKEQVSFQMQSFYKLAKWTHIDGMSMVLLARLHGYAVVRDHRVPYNYSMREVMKVAEAQGWKVFYLGSSEYVAKKSAEIIKAGYPSLHFVNRNGYFDKNKNSTQNRAVLAEIAAFSPDILYVGMGMPIQEQWIEENYDALEARVIFASGAALDYIAKALPTPPEWIGRMGIEWAYRLANEPARLGFRYLAEPWLIIINVLRNRFARRWLPRDRVERSN